MKKINLLISFLLLVSTISYAQKFTDLTATASTGNASLAVDDNPGTRWESESSDPQWLLIDLGETANIGTIKIHWETANAKNYTLSFSNDGISFSNELNYVDMPEGARVDTIQDLNLNFRYIKMTGTERTTGWGYSIWEFEVFPAITPELTSIDVTPVNPSIIIGSSQQFIAKGKDQIGNDFVLTNPTEWSVNESGASIDDNGLFTATSKGLFTITATNSGITDSTTIEVLPSNTNLATSATVTASSGDATLLNDNNKGSRWESEHGIDPQWILIDLGEKKSITDLVIYWEAANAKSYHIETSIDSITWTNFTTQSDLDGGARTDRFHDINTEVRYIKLTGTERNLPYGYSIYEFLVYGGDDVSTSCETLKSPVKAFYDLATKTLYFSETVILAEIYDMSGRLILTSINKNQINIDNLKGYYVLQFVDENNKIASVKILAL